ncbi:RICIN domain-containing protein [Hymenobacter nivis]|uniref:RICIN domain-containing protein n=1 Tax=Hymenobacter nivis TaxID=1850093 RepID=UPI0013A57839|nr:RICIN domain-containing protein [Hymenobacter nivis]
MQNSSNALPLLGGTLLLLAASLASCTKKDFPVVPRATVAPFTYPAAPNAAGAAGIAGLNWADPRDNFTDDALVLSGLAAGDNYATVQTKADAIISGFQARTSANTVRLPINPPTATGPAWAAYQGAIDKALSKGMKVVIGCWESNSSRNGLVDDTTLFFTMWQTVVTKYGGNANVYFEVFNEPHGYSQADLASLYTDWLSRYPNVPQGRVLLDGTGYAQNITGIGADSRFSSCLLSIHLYDFFYSNPTTTAASWESAFAANLGSYASRAVLTEWGAFMTTGVNYSSAIADDVKKSYVLGISNYCRQQGIASVYWPGLRTNDQYSLLQFDGTTTTVSNASGLSRVQFAWGVGAGGTDAFYTSANYRLINRNSSLVVDVNQASTANGAGIIQYAQNGGNNQQWQLAAASGYYTIKNRNSGLLLDVNQASTANAAPIIQYQGNGATNQQWLLAAGTDGYYKITNRNSGQVLDVNGASTATAAGIIQYPSNGGANQQWLLWQQ